MIHGVLMGYIEIFSMLCESCGKLSFLHIKKSCMKCQGAVLINIALLCEPCAISAKSCSACLKKIHSQLTSKKISPGCKSCGR